MARKQKRKDAEVIPMSDAPRVVYHNSTPQPDFSTIKAVRMAPEKKHAPWWILVLGIAIGFIAGWILSGLLMAL